MKAFKINLVAFLVFFTINFVIGFIGGYNLVTTGYYLTDEMLSVLKITSPIEAILMYCLPVTLIIGLIVRKVNRRATAA